MHLMTLKVFSNLKDSESAPTLGRWHIVGKKKKISFSTLRKAGSSTVFPMLEITRKDVKLDMEQFEQETIYREQRVTALKMFC